ncbi:MAG: KR domain-containing protein [Kiritimatiellae bacterium]|nr:KR domain-containing protein [Kiritimatiellia bacterium]
MVAIHRAIIAMETGGCDQAIVGGVNTLITPEGYISFNKAGMLCGDGRCKTFSNQANGYVRGEGVGMLFLKKLSAAKADGDDIYGIIRGSAENHGGQANSLTAPNPKAQSQLLIGAYKRAGIDPATVSYIEAHGTGTELGDPVEINGLKAAFKALYEGRGDAEVSSAHCGLGSVKTNIGHLELAAGVAGVIKVLLQLQHKRLVKNLHCEEINPYIELKDSPFYVVQESKEWAPLKDVQGQELPRRAGVSSFGFGGSNAHIIIEEYLDDSSRSKVQSLELSDEPALIVLSAKNEDRLRPSKLDFSATADQPVAEYLRPFTPRLQDVAYTLQVGREAMEERLGLIVGSIDELAEKLKGFIEDPDDVENLYRGQVKRNKETLAVFTVDEELQEAMDKWVQRRKYSKLLDLWVKGLIFDWSKLYGDSTPDRISLPTYPFARERYWVEGSAFSVPSSGLKDKLHPLMHENTSDVSELRFSSTFTGDELFLTDDMVNGEKLLPGGAYLEMARAAVEEVAGSTQKDQARIQLKNIVWARPISVGTDPQVVHIGLSPEENGEIAYEIYTAHPSDEKSAIHNPQSVEDPSGWKIKSVVHSQGVALFVPVDQCPKFDLQALQETCNQNVLSAEEFYESFKREGLDYGPAHQGLERLYVGDDEVLAKLRVPSSVLETKDQFILYPSLLDLALQASDFTNQQPSVPFAMEELDILGGCGETMWAWIRSSDQSSAANVQKLDIDLCDEEGRMCARMKGVGLQPMNTDIGLSSSDKKKQWFFMKEEWIPRPIPDELGWANRLKEYEGKSITILYSDEKEKDALCTLLKQLEQASHISEALQIQPLHIREMGVDSFEEAPDVVLFMGPEAKEDRSTELSYLDLSVVYHLSQCLMKKAWSKPIRIYYLYEGTTLHPRLECEALSGFVGSAMMENDNHVWTLIGSYDCDVSVTRSQQLVKEWLADESFYREPVQSIEAPSIPKGEIFQTAAMTQVRYEKTQRLVKQRGKTTLNLNLPEVFRHHGTYILAGGLGLIGEELCHELAARYQATLLILSRGAWDEVKQKQCREIEERGGKAHYYSVDVSVDSFSSNGHNEASNSLETRLIHGGKSESVTQVVRETLAEVLKIEPD